MSTLFAFFVNLWYNNSNLIEESQKKGMDNNGKAEHYNPGDNESDQHRLQKATERRGYRRSKDPSFERS